MIEQDNIMEQFLSVKVSDTKTSLFIKIIDGIICRSKCIVGKNVSVSKEEEDKQ